MILTMTQWNEITQYLNGYILDYIVDENSYIYGISSKGEKYLLAQPSGDYWSAMSGKSYEAIDDLIREVKSRIKESGDYSKSNKNKILKNTFEEVIKLYKKQYTN